MAFIVAFYPETTDGDDLELEEVQNAGNVIMKDVEGNSWDIFGEAAVSGPRKGQQLGQPKSFMGYWFAWAAQTRQP